MQAFHNDPKIKWLVLLEDKIYAGLTIKDMQKWPEGFLKAIKPDSDLEKAKAQFLIFLLEGALNSFDHKKYPDVKKVIDGSIALWKRNDIGSKDWRLAANTMARTAHTTWIETEKSAAAVAARAAEARVADAADWLTSTWAEVDMATQDTYKKLADKLIEILEGIK